MSAYREAARLEPEFARAWFELGAAYVRLGERDEVPVVLERLKSSIQCWQKSSRSAWRPDSDPEPLQRYCRICVLCKIM